MLFSAVGLALVAAALSGIIGRVPAALTAGVLSVVPTTVDVTMIDGIMQGMALLTLAAGAFVIKAETSSPSRPADLARASARDVRALVCDPARRAAGMADRIGHPLWLPAASLADAGHPCCAVLSRGITERVVQGACAGEFSMATESHGASLMVGLLEIPNPFVWPPHSDEAYWNWVKENQRQADKKATADWARDEVLRFWWTFPGYMLALVWFKFMQFLFEYAAPGQPVFDEIGFKGPLLLFGLTTMLIAVVIRHQVRRVVLLGWIVFFNAPVFFLAWSSGGRFYNTVMPAVVVSLAVLLFDKEFYGALRNARSGWCRNCGGSRRLDVRESRCGSYVEIGFVQVLRVARRP